MVSPPNEAQSQSATGTSRQNPLPTRPAATFACPYCKGVFENLKPKQLDKHLVKCPARRWRCACCGAENMTRKHFNKHLVRCPAQRWHCGYCGNIFRGPPQAHLARCHYYRKALKLRQDAPMQAAIADSRRRKLIGPPLWTHIPSRSAAKSQSRTTTAWPPIISGGRVESNPRRH